MRNLLIGLFLIGGIAVFIGFILFLHPSVGDEKQTLYVRFSNINKINVGTRVLFGGQAVGEVTRIDSIYQARETQPSDALGRLYFYQLTLKIDSKVKVYDTDEISISTSGLLGEKSVSIIPKAAPKGVVPVLLTEKTPFYADSIDPIENTFSRLSDLGQKLEDTVDLIKNWLEANTGQMTHALASFGNAMDQIDTAISTLNQEQVIPQIKQSAVAFTDSMRRMDGAVAQMERDGVFSNMGAVMANLKSSSTSLDKILGDVSNGQGTLGKLVYSDDLYLRMTAIMSKADTTMNDINNYGVLFHLNKNWQRMRTRRMSTLEALNTPEQFKTYFQGEMDQINTAMARLSVVIDKAQQKPESEKIADSPRFRQDFAELLRKIDEMANNLKLYNEQLAHE